MGIEKRRKDSCKVVAEALGDGEEQRKQIAGRQEIKKRIKGVREGYGQRLLWACGSLVGWGFGGEQEIGAEIGRKVEAASRINDF
ncbi:hypothetical protein HPP92_006632 [Vanilla planifolia]|uniref:Uncharacterized protein n=1 Tax=Vanilla planifolia TaxID=51239 RepID=A0A835RER4_VANPL|nr:hypothetical protein HPP92_006899 [Vanilla planifolia]KAG0489769.1 hypothetical protein HPP92_006632 [Vanilla planifolia]